MARWSGSTITAAMSSPWRSMASAVAVRSLKGTTSMLSSAPLGMPPVSGVGVGYGSVLGRHPLPTSA
jgi:hypothetical protein